jgi:hypothetical protein
MNARSVQVSRAAELSTVDSQSHIFEKILDTHHPTFLAMQRASESSVSDRRERMKLELEAELSSVLMVAKLHGFVLAIEAGKPVFKGAPIRLSRGTPTSTSPP